MDALSERLSKEDYALVEELREQVAIAQCEENESRFKYGFFGGAACPAGSLCAGVAERQRIASSIMAVPKLGTTTTTEYSFTKSHLPINRRMAFLPLNFTSAYVWPCGWAGWGWPFLSYCWGF